MFGNFTLHRATPPFPTPGAAASNGEQIELLRRMLIEIQGEIAVIAARVDSPNARTCLRRAGEFARVAGEFLSQARGHGVDAVVELSVRRDVALADPDAVLAGIEPAMTALSGGAMLARFGLQDCVADRRVLAHAIEGRGWRYTAERFADLAGWWVRVPAPECAS